MTTNPPTPSDIGLPRAAWRVACSVAVTLVVAALGVTMIGPWMLGGKSLVVETGSMRPGIEPGDLVVVKRVDDVSDLRTGDVVTYEGTITDDGGQTRTSFVTHRIIGFGYDRNGATVVTQGDANPAPDAPVELADVRGKVVYALPHAGSAAIWFQDHKLELLGGLGLVWAVSAALDHRRARRARAAAEAARRVELDRLVDERAHVLARELVGVAQPR